MKIELNGMSKEYARECTNILLRMRKLIKNPQCRIINKLPLYLIFTVLYLMYIALAGCYPHRSIDRNAHFLYFHLS